MLMTKQACGVQVRALFSATLPEGVEGLACNVLQGPLRLTVGPRNAPTSCVAQRLMFVGREGGKLLGLRQLVAQGLTPPVLLFVSSKERAEAVHRYTCNHHARSIPVPQIGDGVDWQPYWQLTFQSHQAKLGMA